MIIGALLAILDISYIFLLKECSVERKVLCMLVINNMAGSMELVYLNNSVILSLD